ncbi:hypothetical protein [Deinococcus cellulosilyticus]|uniref:Uncharacterized protein n=1 Tax=Deinococcus cellulosilyticus (strain DSM 18568 / NBRC 106333 / KACC 11606 / 5516J-15) TaxID=1223518 RepID=A0A511MXS4_DEIC1|nr:hypothetical protein [Deinococcus cellulosilyticus]GEM45151.1 hypothetical protein DC3_07860 [Deinococcus cellulosilyticus NBRC 106333 = KACC 11606]
MLYVRWAGLVFMAAVVLFYFFRPETYSLLDYANLIFHEAGHVLFGFSGELLMYLGGSLNQVLVPLLCSGYFAYRRDLYASGLTLMWAAESMINVSVYIRDAQERTLPLITDDPDTHDWWNILVILNRLQQDDAIARVVVFWAFLLYLVALYLGFKGLFAQAQENSG